MKTVLLLTDLFFKAKGREYFREDIELCRLLRTSFNVVICHIADSQRIIHAVDIVLLRNTGPLSTHKQALVDLQKKNLLLFNDLLGKGDINGKGYLLDLYSLGFPVIPSYKRKEDICDASSHYLLKPLDGADSVGVKVFSYKELATEACYNMLIQPLVSFLYEVSFYFIGNCFQYALYAPNPKMRWELKPYKATREDIDFAMQFINWNSCRYGIQRVDGCRTLDGRLLLMELEDYNPYLSLDALDENAKKNFIKNLCRALSCMDI